MFEIIGAIAVAIVGFYTGGRMALELDAAPFSNLAARKLLASIGWPLKNPLGLPDVPKP